MTSHFSNFEYSEWKRAARPSVFCTSMQHAANPCSRPPNSVFSLQFL